MNTNRIGRALVRTALVAVATLALAACFENSPVDELTPDGQGGIDIDGTWSGVVTTTLIGPQERESPGTIELSVSGDEVVMTGGTALETSFPVDLTGTLTDEGGGRFSVAFENDGVQRGVFVFDGAGEYAAFIVDESSAASNGYVSVLQKADLESVSHAEDDLIGDWEGIAVRVDSEYAVTDSSSSSATISDPDPQSEGVDLSGEDGDGTFSAEAESFSGVRLYDEIGLYETGLREDLVVWSDDSSYWAIYALSYDKDVLAVAFLDSSIWGDGPGPMEDLPAQKFALWQRQ
ncbi:MAG: hypothetical protein ACOCW3_03460 [Spirochaetota bacterium]